MRNDLDLGAYVTNPSYWWWLRERQAREAQLSAASPSYHTSSIKDDVTLLHQSAFGSDLIKSWCVDRFN